MNVPDPSHHDDFTLPDPSPSERRDLAAEAPLEDELARDMAKNAVRSVTDGQDRDGPRPGHAAPPGRDTTPPPPSVAPLPTEPIPVPAVTTPGEDPAL